MSGTTIDYPHSDAGSEIGPGFSFLSLCDHELHLYCYFIEKFFIIVHIFHSSLERELFFLGGGGGSDTLIKERTRKVMS